MRDLSRKMINPCMIGDLKSVKELLKNGADIHFDDDDALKVSVEKKQYEIVEYLLNNGANIHADKKEVAEKVVKEYGSDIVNNWLKNKKLNDKLETILPSPNNDIKIKKTKI